MKTSTREWLARTAAKNGITVKKLLRLLDDISAGRKVIYHLDLSSDSAPAKK